MRNLLFEKIAIVGLKLGALLVCLTGITACIEGLLEIELPHSAVLISATVSLTVLFGSAILLVLFAKDEEFSLTDRLVLIGVTLLSVVVGVAIIAAVYIVGTIVILEFTNIAFSIFTGVALKICYGLYLLACITVLVMMVRSSSKTDLLFTRLFLLQFMPHGQSSVYEQAFKHLLATENRRVNRLATKVRIE